MNINRQYDKYLPALLFAAVYLCLLPFYRHKIVSDMVSYLTISKQIAAGHFFESVNAYWSPLISWLIAPFVWLGMEGLLAAKLINLFAGIMVLQQLYKLSIHFTSIRWQQVLIPLLCMHHLLYFGLCNATPDILSLACWFTFFNQLLALVDRPSLQGAIVTGLLAALSYVAKYYNFYAACCFFGLATVLVLVQKRSSLNHLAIAAGVFVGFSFVWISILHNKFGVWVPTTASSFNMNLIRPGGFMEPMQVGDRILPIDYSRFNTTSWEYPLVYPIPNWSPWDNIESLRYHITVHLRNNMLHFRNKHVVEFCAFGLSILYSLFNRKKFKTAQLGLLMSILLYPIGYFWLIALSRYALFSIFVSILWLVVCLNTLNRFKTIAFIVFSIGMAYSHLITYKRIKYYPDKGANYVSFYQTANSHHTIQPQHLLASPSCWAPALYFSYYSQSKLFDVLKPELLQTHLPQLKSLGIQYYFCKRTEVPDWLVPHVVVDAEWVIVKIP